MIDPGYFDPELGAWSVLCPMCSDAIVQPGLVCDSCADVYREETERMDMDAEALNGFPLPEQAA